MELNLSNLLSTEYLFDPAPGNQNTSLLFVIALLFLAVNLLAYLFIRRAKFMAGVHKVLVRAGARINVFIGIAAVVLVFFRTQGFRYLSMRVLLLVLLLMAIINTGYWVIKYIKRKPATVKTQSLETVEGYQQYLPKKKKK
jgi:hypothetical protein